MFGASGYSQRLSSSAWIASSTPGSGPKRFSFQLSLSTSSSPYCSFTSAIVCPSANWSSPASSGVTILLQSVTSGLYDATKAAID